MTTHFKDCLIKKPIAVRPIVLNNLNNDDDRNNYLFDGKRFQGSDDIFNSTEKTCTDATGNRPAIINNNVSFSDSSFNANAGTTNNSTTTLETGVAIADAAADTTTSSPSSYPTSTLSCTPKHSMSVVGQRQQQRQQHLSATTTESMYAFKNNDTVQYDNNSSSTTTTLPSNQQQHPLYFPYLDKRYNMVLPPPPTLPHLKPISNYLSAGSSRSIPFPSSSPPSASASSSLIIPPSTYPPYPPPPYMFPSYYYNVPTSSNIIKPTTITAANANDNNTSSNSFSDEVKHLTRQQLFADERKKRKLEHGILTIPKPNSRTLSASQSLYSTPSSSTCPPTTFFPSSSPASFLKTMISEDEKKKRKIEQEYLEINKLHESNNSTSGNNSGFEKSSDLLLLSLAATSANILNHQHEQQQHQQQLVVEQNHQRQYYQQSNNYQNQRREIEKEEDGQEEQERLKYFYNNITNNTNDVVRLPSVVTTGHHPSAVLQLEQAQSRSLLGLSLSSQPPLQLPITPLPTSYKECSGSISGVGDNGVSINTFNSKNSLNKSYVKENYYNMYSDTRTYFDYYKQLKAYIESAYSDNNNYSAIDLSLKKDEETRDGSKKYCEESGDVFEKYKDEKYGGRGEKDEELNEEENREEEKRVVKTDVKEEENYDENKSNRIGDGDGLTLTFYNDDTGEEVVTHHKCLEINPDTIFPEINIIQDSGKELKLNNKYNGETVVPIRETVNNDFVYNKNVDVLGAGTSSKDSHVGKTSSAPHNILQYPSRLKLKKFVKANAKNSSSDIIRSGSDAVVSTEVDGSNCSGASKNKTNRIYRESIANKTVVAANNVYSTEKFSNFPKNNMNKRKYEMYKDNNNSFNSTNVSNNISEGYGNNITNNVYSSSGKISSVADNNGSYSTVANAINDYTENVNFDRVYVKKQKLLDDSYHYIPQPWYMNNGVMINKHLNVKRLLLNTFNDYNKCYKYFVEIDNRILNSRNKTFEGSYNVQSVQKKIMHCMKRYLGDTRIPNIECYRLHCNETNVVFVYFIISLQCKLPFYLQNNGYCLYYTENKSIEHKKINFSKDVGQSVNTMLFTETRFIPESTNFSTLFYMHIMDNCVNCKKTLLNLDDSTIISNSGNGENEILNNNHRHYRNRRRDQKQNILHDTTTGIESEAVAAATAAVVESLLSTTHHAAATEDVTNNIKGTDNNIDNGDEYDISNEIITNDDIENIMYSPSHEMILSLSTSSLLDDDNDRLHQHRSSIPIGDYGNGDISDQRQRQLLLLSPSSSPSTPRRPVAFIPSLSSVEKSPSFRNIEVSNRKRKYIQSSSSSTAAAPQQTSLKTIITPAASSTIASLDSPILLNDNNNVQNRNTFDNVDNNMKNELLSLYPASPSFSSSSNISNASSSSSTISLSPSASKTSTSRARETDNNNDDDKNTAPATDGTVIDQESELKTKMEPKKSKILSNVFQKRKVDSTNRNNNTVVAENELLSLKKNEKDCLSMLLEENDNDDKKIGYGTNVSSDNNNVERIKKNRKIKRNREACGGADGTTYCVGCDMIKQKMPNNGGVDNVRKVFSNTKDVLSDFENTVCRDFIRNLKSNVSETDMTVLFQCVLHFNRTVQSCEIENNTNLDTNFQYESTSEIICEISKPILESLYSSEDAVKTLPVDEKSILEGLLDSWITRDYCNHSFIVRPLSGWCNYLFSWMDLAYEVNSNGEKIIRYTSYDLNADKVLIDSSSNLSIIFYDFIIYSTNNSENIYISTNSEVEIYSMLTFINKNVNMGWPINKIYSDKYQCYEYNASNGEFKIETRNIKRQCLNGSVCIRCYNIRVSTDTCEVQLIISREIIITNLCKTICYMSKNISNRDMAALSVHNIPKAINRRDHANNFDHRSTNDISWCSNWIQRSINLKKKSDQQFYRNKK